MAARRRARSTTYPTMPMLPAMPAFDPTFGMDLNKLTQAYLGAWSPTPALTKTWISTMTSMWTIGFTAQQVIWLRLSRIAAQGATAANQREMQRMVSEKVDAMNESALSLVNASMAMAGAVPGDLSDVKKAQRWANNSARSLDRALRPYSRRVSANHQRLSRG